MRHLTFTVQGSLPKVALLAFLLAVPAFGKDEVKDLPPKYPAARDLTGGWWLRVTGAIFTTGTMESGRARPIRFDADGTWSYHAGSTITESEHVVQTWQSLPDGDVVIMNRRHRWLNDHTLVSTDGQRAYIAYPPLAWPQGDWQGGKRIPFVMPDVTGAKTYAPLIAARKGYDVAALRAREQYERAMEKAKADYLSNLRVVEASAARESNAAGVKEVAEEKARVEGEPTGSVVELLTSTKWAAGTWIYEFRSDGAVVVTGKNSHRTQLRTWNLDTDIVKAGPSADDQPHTYKVQWLPVIVGQNNDSRFTPAEPGQ